MFGTFNENKLIKIVLLEKISKNLSNNDIIIIMTDEHRARL